MSRYDNRFKDDLIDELKFRYDESGMGPHQFIVILLQIVADLVGEIIWEEDNPPK